MPIGGVVQRLETCSSTSDIARELASQGAAHGTVVVAEEQTQGRGTKGRSWHSPRGRGLYASIILRPVQGDRTNLSLRLLPLAAGLAGSDAVQNACGVSVRLKWPNDLVWRKRKLGGILSESLFLGRSLVHSIIGVGININQDEADFPPSLRPLSTSLFMMTGRGVDKELLLDHLCRALESWYNTLRRGENESLIRMFEERMAFSRGDRLVVGTSGGRVAGIYSGLKPDGRLIVEIPGGPRVFSFEEILSLDGN